MNYQNVVDLVSFGNVSLVFLAKEFGGLKPIGSFIKDKDGNLTKIHGKTANLARKELQAKTGIVRSYGKAKAMMNNKTKTVFMTEFLLFDSLGK